MTTDPHRGLACAEVEALLDLRHDQLTRARNRLRDEPRATHPANLVHDVTAARQRAHDAIGHRDSVLAFLSRQGDAAEEIDNALAALARCEAVARGDETAAAALAPTDPWTAAVHSGTMLHLLATLSQVLPELLPQARAELLALANTEGADDDD